MVMELGIWGSLWANCALGATFLALPTLVEAPLFQQINNDLLAVQNNDLNTFRNDTESPTIAELTAESESASDSETQDESDLEQEQDIEQDDDTEDDNTSGTDATNYIIKQDVNLNTSCDSVETEIEDKDTKNGAKKKKPYQRIRYGREEYRCTICPYTCTTERAFLKHLRFHATDDNKDAQSAPESVNPRLSCPVCGKDRNGENALNIHMQKHRDDKNFCCDICSFKTVQLKKLIQHRRMHTGERPHLCPHCVYRAARRDNLRSHVRRVHKKENLTCDTFSPRGMLIFPSRNVNKQIDSETDKNISKEESI